MTPHTHGGVRGSRIVVSQGDAIRRIPVAAGCWYRHCAEAGDEDVAARPTCLRIHHVVRSHAT